MINKHFQVEIEKIVKNLSISQISGVTKCEYKSRTFPTTYNEYRK